MKIVDESCGEVAKKHLRTCINCREKFERCDLLRIVKTGDKSVVFDRSGKMAGRGAYVCSIDCCMAMVGTGKLERALKCGVSNVEQERLAAEIAASCGISKEF